MNYCLKCGVMKEPSAFHKNKRYASGLQKWCIECRKVYDNLHRQKRSKTWLEAYERNHKNPISRAGLIFRSARKRAKERNEIFDVDIERVKFALLLGVCERTGIPFDLSHPKNGKSTNAFAPSIDKIDQTKFYTNDNIQIVLWAYNVGKHEMTDFEYEEFILKAARNIQARRQRQQVAA